MQVTSSGVVKYKFDFLKYRYAWLAVSIAYVVIGVAIYFVKGGFSYHVDFTGGAEVRVSFEQSLDIGKLRGIMTDRGWKDASIQSVG